MKKLIFLALFFSVASYPFLCSAEPEIKVVTDKYIFSAVDDENFVGEGFFVILKNGEELFIYSLAQDDPFKIENMRMKFMALAKDIGSFKYSKAQQREIYLALKFDLGAEHALLPEQTYLNLADTIMGRGERKNLTLVYFQDVEFDEDKTVFFCNKITSVGEITMTTGRSVHIFTINFENSDPLNVVISARRPGTKEELEGLRERIIDLKGTAQEIVASELQYQHTIYTFSGTTFGWIVHLGKVSIR